MFAPNKIPSSGIILQKSAAASVGPVQGEMGEWRVWGVKHCFSVFLCGFFTAALAEAVVAESGAQVLGGAATKDAAASVDGSMSRRCSHRKGAILSLPTHGANTKKTKRISDQITFV